MKPYAAQFLYVGAQVTRWTFIVQYGTHLFMVLFCCSRFVCSALMRRFCPASMLPLFAAAAFVLGLVVLLVGGRVGVYGWSAPRPAGNP